jgi:hypothetical protein
MRPGKRFDVFKRDGFVCAYCGKRPPETVLEVDHIVPRAKGGSDDEINLITACKDCNRGKSDKSLSDPIRPTVSPEQSEEIKERALQAAAYAEAVQTKRDHEDEVIATIEEHWWKAAGGTEDGNSMVLPPGFGWPSVSTLRKFVRRLPLDEILEAVDIAIERMGAYRAEKYFYGICWSKIRERDQ